MKQSYDPRNADIQVGINDMLVHRNDARVSVFDSVVQGGDAVWEGLRVYNGTVYALEEHLHRLRDSAHALAFTQIPSISYIKRAIGRTLQANGMFHDAHIRLTLTRGEKYTSGMDPRLNTKGCTLIVLAEWKPPVYGTAPITLITASVRRNNPNHLDSKIHHNNLLNNILAKIEANVAGADDALMLDTDGFVAETNATNFFLIKNGRLLTPPATSCLPGITRQWVIDTAPELGISITEQHISLTECYTADHAFVTGTMGELVPVQMIDGRAIDLQKGAATFQQLQEAYRLATKQGIPIDELLESNGE